MRLKSSYIATDHLDIVCDSTDIVAHRSERVAEIALDSLQLLTKLRRRTSESLSEAIVWWASRHSRRGWSLLRGSWRGLWLVDSAWTDTGIGSCCSSEKITRMASHNVLMEVLL
jgi:hypothetical protein